MPSQELIKRLGVNPFAVCASNGLKRGTPKGERCIEGVTRSAMKRKAKSGHKPAKSGQAKNAMP